MRDSDTKTDQSAKKKLSAVRKKILKPIKVVTEETKNALSYNRLLYRKRPDTPKTGSFPLHLSSKNPHIKNFEKFFSCAKKADDLAGRLIQIFKILDNDPKTAGDFNGGVWVGHAEFATMKYIGKHVSDNFSKNFIIAAGKSRGKIYVFGAIAGGAIIAEVTKDRLKPVYSVIESYVKPILSHVLSHPVADLLTVCAFLSKQTPIGRASAAAYTIGVGIMRYKDYQNQQRFSAEQKILDDPRMLAVFQQPYHRAQRKDDDSVSDHSKKSFEILNSSERALLATFSVLARHHYPQHHFPSFAAPVTSGNELTHHNPYVQYNALSTSIDHPFSNTAQSQFLFQSKSPNIIFEEALRKVMLDKTKKDEKTSYFENLAIDAIKKMEFSPERNQYYEQLAQNLYAENPSKMVYSEEPVRIDGQEIHGPSLTVPFGSQTNATVIAGANRNGNLVLGASITTTHPAIAFGFFVFSIVLNVFSNFTQKPLPGIPGSEALAAALNDVGGKPMTQKNIEILNNALSDFSVRNLSQQAEELTQAIKYKMFQSKLFQKNGKTNESVEIFPTYFAEDTRRYVEDYYSDLKKSLVKIESDIKNGNLTKASDAIKRDAKKFDDANAFSKARLMLTQHEKNKAAVEREKLAYENVNHALKEGDYSKAAQCAESYPELKKQVQKALEEKTACENFDCAVENHDVASMQQWIDKLPLDLQPEAKEVIQNCTDQLHYDVARENILSAVKEGEFSLAMQYAEPHPELKEMLSAQLPDLQATHLLQKAATIQAENTFAARNAAFQLLKEAQSFNPTSPDLRKIITIQLATGYAERMQYSQGIAALKSEYAGTEIPEDIKDEYKAITADQIRAWQFGLALSSAVMQQWILSEPDAKKEITPREELIERRKSARLRSGAGVLFTLMNGCLSDMNETIQNGDPKTDKNLVDPISVEGMKSYFGEKIDNLSRIFNGTSSSSKKSSEKKNGGWIKFGTSALSIVNLAVNIATEEAVHGATEEYLTASEEYCKSHKSFTSGKLPFKEFQKSVKIFEEKECEYKKTEEYYSRIRGRVNTAHDVVIGGGSAVACYNDIFLDLSRFKTREKMVRYAGSLENYATIAGTAYSVLACSASLIERQADFKKRRQNGDAPTSILGIAGEEFCRGVQHPFVSNTMLGVSGASTLYSAGNATALWLAGTKTVAVVTPAAVVPVVTASATATTAAAVTTTNGTATAAAGYSTGTLVFAGAVVVGAIAVTIGGIWYYEHCLRSNHLHNVKTKLKLAEQNNSRQYLSEAVKANVDALKTYPTNADFLANIEKIRAIEEKITALELAQQKEHQKNILLKPVYATVDFVAKVTPACVVGFFNAQKARLAHQHVHSPLSIYSANAAGMYANRFVREFKNPTDRFLTAFKEGVEKTSLFP